MASKSEFIINAIDKSGAQAVALIGDALAGGANELNVLVDKPGTAMDAMNFLKRHGFQVTIEDNDGTMTLAARYTSTTASPAQSHSPAPAATSPAPLHSTTPAPVVASPAQSHLLETAVTSPVQSSQSPQSTPPAQTLRPTVTPVPTPPIAEPHSQVINTTDSMVSMAVPSTVVSSSSLSQISHANSPSGTPSRSLDHFHAVTIPTTAATPATTSPSSRDLKSSPSTLPMVVLIRGSTLGTEDPDLGRILMLSFLSTLATLASKETQNPIEIGAIVLMNGGVKLATFESSACDYLKDLQVHGTKIFVSGICAAHFGLTEQIGVGEISNMYEIVKVLARAKSVITL